MHQEILEQPDVIAHLATEGFSSIAEAARAARNAGARFVIYVARGTSDNSCVYGQYLSTVCAGMPSGLGLPSTATLYGAPTDYRACLVIGVSQSGETPDVAAFVRHARCNGAFTIAVTNHARSSLGQVAHCSLLTSAGEEVSVPATKTYTGELAVLALFWASWSRSEALLSAMREKVPLAMRSACKTGGQVESLAEMLETREHLLIIARGYNYSTALETALKLRETSYLAATPFAAPDLVHGPIAMIEPGYPVLIFAVPGRPHAELHHLARDLQDRGAEVWVISDARRGAKRAVVLNELRTIPEPLSPLIAIIPGQLLSLNLSLRKGLNPDNPRGLNKITRY